MKRLFLLFLSGALLLAFTTEGRALPYTGSLQSDSTLHATGGWAGGGATLSWVVDNTTNPGFWTYAYTFTVARKDISHVLMEVSGNFSTNNIISASAGIDEDAPRIYSPSGPGNSNPGLPGDLFGIKWDASGTSFSWTIETDRAPMWGDFYAKDGTDRVNELQVDVIAYNLGFGTDPSAPIGDGNASIPGVASGWALVPDTTATVPEPATMLLLGSGLIGLADFARKKFRGK